MSDTPRTLADLAKAVESLVAFDYQADGDGYSRSADAAWKAALAAFNFAARELGLTGFQASWAALKFYAEAMHIEGPFIMLKAEDALYPQYDLPGRLQTFLDEQRPWLAEQARKRLDGDLTFAAERVIEHWRALAGGES